LERVFGKHPVRAVFLARPTDIRRLIIARDEAYHEDLATLAADAGLKPEFLDWPDFLRLGGFTKDERHQGVFILAEPRPVFTERDFDTLEDARVVLALDQISDPQNLATMVRCAAFFGVEAILLLRDRSADVTSDVVRQAVGGVEFVKVFRVTNLSQSLDTLKDFGFFVVGMDERGEKTLAETDFPDKLVLVVGAEGDGLRAKTKKYCDALVRIPGGRRGVESLNAGVATAIALAEVFRDSGKA
jgi:23S rRNA (guanosine2251-2'-O)-methyltransferase